jgi:hypothetical protein
LAHFLQVKKQAHHSLLTSRAQISHPMLLLMLGLKLWAAPNLFHWFLYYSNTSALPE